MKKLVCGLIVGLLLSLMCVPAYAALYINDERISGDYLSEDGTFVYDAATGTLTLNNFNSTGFNSPIFANGGEIREIVLNGNSAIAANAGFYGIMIWDSALKIRGSGSLMVESDFAPIYVPDGAVTIDEATVTLKNASGTQQAMYAKKRIDLVNGAKLSVYSDCFWGTVYILTDNDPSEGIHVSGESTLEICGIDGSAFNPFNGPLVVRDTSRAIILSGDLCTPASFDGIADSITLNPVLLPNAMDYGDSWTLNPGEASGRYAFTVNQTNYVENYSVLYRVEIQGTALNMPSPEPGDTAVSLPQTGDSSKPMLWLAMGVLSMLGILLLKKKAYSR
ncbi:MAG: LPXTG cell wall anchor domain-containing protein [Clostridia bacterium]|nr:LPXTG cell wall anchor domain-containing protein [Clostridia bacterium]